jgi:hypothetical protein
MDIFSFTDFLMTIALYSLLGFVIYRFFITPKSIREGLTVFFINIITFLIIYPTGNILLWLLIAVLIPIPLSLIFKTFTKGSLIKYIFVVTIFLLLYLTYK